MTPTATPIWVLPTLVALSYLIGCLSPGWFLARARGIDLRKEGSGATGATNAARVLGPSAYKWVLFFDTMKAFVAVYGTYWILPHDPWGALASPAVIAGHIWPFWLKFKGGKGAGPVMGAFIGFDWRIVALAWIPGLLIGKLVSKKGFAVRAVAFVASLGIGLWIMRRNGTHQAYYRPPAQMCLVLSWLLVLLAHRSHFGKQVPG
jgi:glycerol-3-phosphate acyltransferase PlsY